MSEVKFPTGEGFVPTFDYPPMREDLCFKGKNPRYPYLTKEQKRERRLQYQRDWWKKKYYATKQETTRETPASL